MRKIVESELAYRDGDSGVKYLLRGPKIDWGVILLLPGQTLGRHYHEEVEETFYVVQGKGTFLVNDQELPAAEAIHVDAGERPGHPFTDAD